MPKPKSLRLRGMTTIEALLVAAAFIIVGVIGVMVFQGMGKSVSEALRVNAIVTADRGGFDVTVEVLNGKLEGIELRIVNPSTTVSTQSQGCVAPPTVTASPASGVPRYNINPALVAGQSISCRFTASLSPGQQYTYVIYAIDGNTRKAVQIAKGVVTIGIS
ncbi:hypothetical protein Pogu_0735 [Pyrobaculum oguniense TE7]|uniref:Archaeal flagellin N-terminal-like domain protein n=1 Tax=Pyrobaculum oguniense (strain DSM 13380 / JCM 10595 / TE7) TaxID=698757 RepID=H6Q832_PYROT|nr:hypothetical protein Pogu_0735 [Pyrobaculum oguniense TE7]